MTAENNQETNIWLNADRINETLLFENQTYHGEKLLWNYK